MANEVYQLKVALRESKPSVYRRLLVPADVTLERLHRILQVSMGWTDTHLHQYRQGSVYYGTRDPEFGMERVSERSTTLNSLLLEPKDRMVYEYDFGDGWEHDVVLEKIQPTEPGQGLPFVIEGRGACPPEDVGGIGGYYDFLEAMSDPRHPEHDHMVSWWGPAFDPDRFDLQEVNKILRQRFQRRRPRASGGTVIPVPWS